MKVIQRMTMACVAAAAMMLAAGCSSDSTGPEDSGSGEVASSFTISLATPNTDDGAIQLLVTGAAVDSVTTTQAFVFATPVGAATTTRVIIAGNLTPGAVGTVWVSPATTASKLSATVEQVAQRGTFADRATSGYGIAFTAR